MSDPSLRLRVLGAPSAQVDGLEIVVDTRKATALLAYLAVQPGAHRRDTLAYLLWPEYENDRARAALRRTLSTLRSALGGRFVEVSRDTVSLDRAALWLDAERFRELAGAHSTADLEEAAALHRGPFLAGFALRDSVVFDDWQSLEAGLLARELGVVLDRLAGSLARDGELAAALRHAERRLALDPLHEPAHYRLIELYARSGDRRAALSQYRDCVRRLHRELGVAPLEATTELYRSIREGTTSARVEPSPAPAPPSGTRPLVGRGDELGALRAAYAEVGASGKLVVVEGEVGIGKTRLLGELVGWARSEGSVAVSVRSFEHEASLAYGSAIELLRAALRDGTQEPLPQSALAEAARLLPELGTPPLRPLDEPGAAVRFYEGIVGTLLAATAGRRPAVLVVDDAHWADASSLEVLAYLARRLAQRPVLLVLSWRPEDTPTDHPARRVLAEAQRDGLASTIRLGRLGRADVDRLVAAAGAAPEISTRLFEETQGVPFYIDEYLDAGSHEWSLPAGVRELLEARLATASEIGAQVLAAAAVLGRAFDADTVRDVSGRSDEEVVGALDELIARGILAELEGPAYDFRHEQARKVAYERASTGRRRLLHGRAADVLAARARIGASASIVGQHLRIAGRSGEAAGWFHAAGEQARELHANAEALSHFREALALGYPDVTALQRAVGDLQTLDGRYGEALASYEAAAALASDDERAAIEHRIGLVHHRRGEWQLAQDSFEAALSIVGDDLERRARILADRSLTAHRSGQAAEAHEVATEALACAEAAGDERAVAQAHNILGILAGGRGEHAAARAHLERSLALADSHDDDVARIAALNNLALVDQADGELARALELTEHARRLCATVGDRHREAALANNTADLLHAAGRHDEAMVLLKEAVALFAEIGDEGAMEPEIWKLREW